MRKKQGLSRSSRMTERPQFVRLFDNPYTYKSSTFIAFWKENELKSSRLGITLKGKLSSVWRMKIKRLVREWFRTRKQEFQHKNQCVDLNVVVRIPQKIDYIYYDRLKKQLQDWK